MLTQVFSADESASVSYTVNIEFSDENHNNTSITSTLDFKLPHNELYRLFRSMVREHPLYENGLGQPSELIRTPEYRVGIQIVSSADPYGRKGQIYKEGRIQFEILAAHKSAYSLGYPFRIVGEGWPFDGNWLAKLPNNITGNFK